MADRLKKARSMMKDKIDPNDADLILSLIENGDVSDIEELNESNDEEDVVIQETVKPGTNIRIGADEDTKHQSELIEMENDYTDVDTNGDSGFVFTKKQDIKWVHRPIAPLEISYDEPTESEDSCVQTPIEYFSRYIPNNLFQEIVDKTNLYATQQCRNTFKHTSSDEIKTLFGLHMAVGTVKFPRVKMYWNTTLGLDLFKNHMTKNRFFQLRNNLHLVNVLDKPADCNDRFYKVRPIYDAVRKRCCQLKLEKVLCVDEQMVPFRGQLNVKQYIKGKPHPWGIMVFVICGKSGLAYDFIIYQGSTTEIDNKIQATYGLGPGVVLHLVERVTSPGHELYYDNYFSSYALLQILKRKNIYAGGTVRINRFANPPLISEKDCKKKERGYSEEVSSRDGDVSVVKWFDNRGVILASNFIGIGNKDKVKRWDKSNSKYVEVLRPEIVKRYNHGMGGVDLLDQLIGLYRIFVRSRKWTLRMIFHAVDFAVVNSWLEYRQHANLTGISKSHVMDLLDFKLMISEALVKAGKPCPGTKRGRPSSSPSLSPISSKRINMERRPLKEIQLDSVDHMPLHDQKKEPTRCKQQNCKNRTHILCRKCGVHLCINRERNCFSNFHSQ